MNQLSDQTRARMMLETRKRGYSYSIFLRDNAKRYLIIVACFMPALGLFAFLQSWMPFSVVFGILCGSFLRDIDWVRGTCKALPFSTRVTDWEKVQKLADGQPIEE